MVTFKQIRSVLSAIKKENLFLISLNLMGDKLYHFFDQNHNNSQIIMFKKYRSTMDRLHDYLCKDTSHPIVQIHHSHIDHNKLFKSRLICFIYISAIYLWVLWDMASITTNFIYLTLHGYFITWLFYTVVLQDYWFTKVYGSQGHPCPKLKHYIEIMYETALCFEFPITLVFWTFLFPILLRNNATISSIIMNTNLHLGPLVCLLVELYYNNFSFPKRHLWVLILYGSGYLAINLAYSLTVKVIYEPIDWKSILSYALVISSLLFVIGAHYFARFSYRRWKAHKLQKKITQGLIQQIQTQHQSPHNYSQQVIQNLNKLQKRNQTGSSKEGGKKVNEGRMLL